MLHIELVAWNTGGIIYSGQFSSVKTCIEAAITDGVKLDYLTMQDADLATGNFDNASFNYARFTRCNLNGVNLSECSLIKSEWTDCDLRHACLSDSVAVGSRFNGSVMDHIDVGFADMRGISVTCAAFLKSDFSQTTHLNRSVFMAGGVICPMTRGPVFVRGLGLDVVLLDEHVVMGSTIVLRRDQLATQEGLIRQFAQHGLTPHTTQLASLWHAVRGTHTQAHAA